MLKDERKIILPVFGPRGKNAEKLTKKKVKIFYPIVTYIMKRGLRKFCFIYCL